MSEAKKQLVEELRSVLSTVEAAEDAHLIEASGSFSSTWPSVVRIEFSYAPKPKAPKCYYGMKFSMRLNGEWDRYFVATDNTGYMRFPCLDGCISNRKLSESTVPTLDDVKALFDADEVKEGWA